MQMVERSDADLLEREREIRRLGARHLRARRREEQRRAEQMLMEIAWSRLC